ncbi:MAG: protein translocase subunit SecD [Kiritimatiellae bacterium]|nr:protein translocase subunit SecD [Kiritimatiellia bacterium]
MVKKDGWKWLILIALVGVSFIITWPPAEKIKYGLDIRGGASFMVEVDKADLRQRIRNRGDVGEQALDAAVMDEAREARDISMEALRSRIDGLGIAEPAIYPQGDDRVVIQLPGVDQSKMDEARRSIQGVAFLEFRLVHKNSGRWVERMFDEARIPRGFKPATVGQQQVLLRDREAVKDTELDSAFFSALRRFAPREGAELMLERHGEGGAEYYVPYYIETVQQLTGKAVQDSMVDYDQLGRPKIALQFTSEGRRRFAQVTRDYSPQGDKNRNSADGRQLAIILDGQLRSAPELRTEISDGRAEITGSFSQIEARQLVNVLRTGALAAPMRIIEERSVEPTLGKDAVRSGVRAAIYGAIIVVVFIVGFYLLPGLIASFALVLDVLLLPVSAVLIANIFGMFGGSAGGSSAGLPVLTLPGIAGIALTLGMAVDANVLIFERIREEQNAGKHFGPAVDAGYDCAFITIFDSNITTLLAAVIMFTQGSGPVRGYAITLSAGILVSMYTAIVVTRMIFNRMIASGKFTSVRMLSILGKTHVDFMRLGKPALALSATAIIILGVLFVRRGAENYGVDFTGGSALMVEFKERVPVDDIRKVLADAGIDATPQYQEVGGDKQLVIRVGEEQGEQAESVVESAFAEQGFVVTQQDTVGAQVGDELKRKGLLALMWAIIGMTIYITFRFEFSFAVGSLVALAHDAVLAVGLFSFFGRTLSTPMIAALLTIIGYSVNDTIVIFDRIREQRKLHPGSKFRDAANLAINQTLSRTILTSGTTLMTVTALLLFGGGSIFDLALMLFIGIVVGTYSSIFIATPIAQLWYPERKTPEFARKTAKAAA